MNDRTFAFVVVIGIAFIVMSFFLVLQHKAQVHGLPILHGFYYGNGSLYHTSLTCFDDITAFKRYVQDHANGSEETIVYPCPPFDKSKVPEFEGGN